MQSNGSRSTRVSLRLFLSCLRWRLHHGAHSLRKRHTETAGKSLKPMICSESKREKNVCSLKELLLCTTTSSKRESQRRRLSCLRASFSSTLLRPLLLSLDFLGGSFGSSSNTTVLAVTLDKEGSEEVSWGKEKLCQSNPPRRHSTTHNSLNGIRYATFNQTAAFCAPLTKH